ncbi:hypothetical protein VUR80DRAFT_3698 [Thermomyces stellatus]
MYGPAPPRPKRTQIVRARTGCKGCRKRRTKCDEQKPSCGTCTRLGRPCEPVSPKFRFHNLTNVSTGVQRQRRGHDDSPISDVLDVSVLPGNGYVNRGPQASGHSPDGTVSPGAASSVDSPLSARIASASDSSMPLGPPDYFRQMDDLDREEDRAAVRMPPVLLPHRDSTHVIVFYMDVWRRQCMPGLHSAFHRLETLHNPPMLTDIKVALSACRLSRVLPQRKIASVSSIGGLCFRPDAGHESMSYEHYGAVMRKMARWGHRDFDANPGLGLAVLILFCYLESSMGNFREFRLHSEGTRRLMHAYSDWIVCRGGGLLAAWVEVEMQNWWRRVYFGTPDFHRNHGSLSLPAPLEGVLNTGDHQRAAIVMILCESHRLNNAAIVSAWDAHRDKGSLAADDVALLPGSAGTQSYGEGLSVGDYAALLRAQSKKLDRWLDRLPVSDLPERWQYAMKDVGPDGAEPDIQPLRFNSHVSAMNFAYYVTARVMQCTGPIETLEAPCQADLDEAYEETEAWVSLLLRIAAGIRWEDCLHRNVFTIGFTGLLLACALRSRRLAAGIWMQNWLEERLKGKDFEEGNFPVFQILEAVRLINRERMNGMDVLALFQTVDDGGGSGKLGSYHSQMLVALCVYGRDRSSGGLCSYQRTLLG